MTGTGRVAVVLVVGIVMTLMAPGASAQDERQSSAAEVDVGGVVDLLQQLLEQRRHFDARLADLEALVGPMEYTVRFFNLDTNDTMTLRINGVSVMECNWPYVEACVIGWADFAAHLDEGRNHVAIEATRGVASPHYGYEVFRRGALWRRGTCGVALNGNTVTVCEELVPNHRPVTLLEFVVQHAPPTG